jgi:hypothetical protein
LKALLITNVITKAVFTICITILAISFNNTGILWWFVLLPFLGYTYIKTPVVKGGAE